MITRQETLVNRLLTLTSVLLLGLSLVAQAQILEAPNINGNPLAMFIITNLLAEPQPELSVPLFSQTNTGPEGNYWRFQGPPVPLPLDAFPALPVFQIGTNQYLIDDRSVDYPALNAMLESNAEAEVEGWTNPPETITLMDTNGLWINLPTNSLAMPDYFFFNLMNTLQGQGYDILTTTDLLASWATELTVTGAVGNITPVPLPMNNRTNLFVGSRTSADYSFYLVTEPLSQAVCDGDTVTFSVETGGNTNLSYQWTLNGVAIPGATNSSYSISGYLESDAGNYACVISDGTNSLTTAPAQLTTQWLWNDLGVVYLLGNRQDYTFMSGVTYYIGWPIMLVGNTTIEAGAVLKFDWHNNASLQIMGALTCKGEPYYPAMLTSVDDDSAGEPLIDPYKYPLSFGYEDGPPQLYPTGVPYLEMANATSNSISNLRISYADWGVTTPLLSQTLDVWDCQFVQCNFGVVNLVAGTGAADNLHNVLFSQCYAAVAASTNAIDIGAEQVTAQVTTFCLADVTPGTIALTNSIIYGNGLTASNLLTVNVVSNPDSTNFQAAGAGNYYLAPTSTLHNAGTANISPRLQSELQGKTTYPPIVIAASTPLSGAMTLAPQAARYASGASDLGYYYDALDYTVDDMILTGGTLTVLPGTAIGYRFDTNSPAGIYAEIGFDVQANSSLISQGTPNHPNYFVDVQEVQEQFTWPVLAGIVPDFLPTDPGSQPPLLSFRFSKFRLSYLFSLGYGPEPAFHIFSGVDPISPCDLSFNSAMYLTLQDCDFRGGQISLGQPDQWLYDRSLFWGAAAVGWTNNSFDNVCINLDPSYYNEYGYTNVDLAFSAYNNLFRGGWLRLQPIPASAGNWSFNDNLFDQVEIAQDTAVPLTFSNNGYWPLPPRNLWWDAGFYPGSLGYYSANLQPTSSAHHEVTLSSIPPYQTGRFGHFYLPNTTALYGAGSRTPANAGLYHYTTRLDQVKEGNESAGHNVNIGVHYVAANNYSLPMDSDADGIPDYVENWHGDGAYANWVGMETDWQNPMTDGVNADPSNSLYLNVDLSGDGLVGRVKAALGINPLDASNPLSLTQVFTGDEPDIATFSVPISYATLTNSGLLQLCADGAAPAFQECVPGGNGNCLLVWNTTYNMPGQHYLQAQISLNGQIVQGATPDPTVLSGSGAVAPFYSSNAAMFDPFYAEYDAGGAILYAQLPQSQADYSIELRTPSGQHIKTITGSTSSGIIKESWDLTDDNTNSYGGDAVEACFTVTPAGSSTSRTNKLALNLVDHSLLGDANVTVAYAWDNDSLAQGAMRDCVQWGIVDELIKPGWAGGMNPNPYLSTFNDFSWSGGPGNPGYLSCSNDIFLLMNNLADPQTMNFHFDGHGSQNGIGNGKKQNDPALLNIASADITMLLTNNFYVKLGLKRQHPYRVVNLDACETADGLSWSQAFGVLPRITTAQLADQPMKVQAFVGWKHSPRAPNSTGEFYDEASTFAVFYGGWMNGFTLDSCISYASNPHPPPPLQDITLNFPLGLHFLPYLFYWEWAWPPGHWGCNLNSFKIQVMGYAGITRDGYQPGHDNSPYYYTGQ